MARGCNNGWDFVKAGEVYQYREGGLIAEILVLEDNSDEEQYSFNVRILRTSEEYFLDKEFEIMHSKDMNGVWNYMPQIFEEPEYIVMNMFVSSWTITPQLAGTYLPNNLQGGFMNRIDKYDGFRFIHVRHYDVVARDVSHFGGVTIAWREEGGGIRIGVARCNIEDRYEKPKGRLLSVSHGQCLSHDLNFFIYVDDFHKYSWRLAAGDTLAKTIANMQEIVVAWAEDHGFGTRDVVYGKFLPVVE